MTTVANAVVWWLVLTTGWFWWRARGGRRDRLIAAAAGEPRALLAPGLLWALAAMALAGVLARLIAGLLAPGDFGQEAVAYRSWIAGSGLYPADFQAHLRQWLADEPLPFADRLPEPLRIWRTEQLDHLVRLYVVQAHPPPLMLAFAPLFASIGAYGTFLALAGGGLAAFARSAVALARALEFRPVGHGALAVVVLFGWQPVLANLRHGQPGLFVAAAIVGAYLAYRSGRDVLCGVLIALATALKVFPALLLIVLAVRRPRALLAAGATLAAVGLAVTAAAGVQAWSDFAAAARTVSSAFGSAPTNFSLRSLSIAVLPDHGDAAFLIMAAVMVVVTLVHVIGRDDDPEGLGYAAFACLALLLSPTCWSHYFVLMLLPLALAARGAFATGSVGRVVTCAACALAVSLPDRPIWALYWRLAASAGQLAGHLIASFPMWAVVAVWVLLLSQLRQQSRPGLRLSPVV